MASAGSRKYSKFPDPDTEPRPKRRGRWILLGLLVIVAAVIGFAPSIIGQTPLRNWVAQSALNVNGTVTIGGASLGWFSPVELTNVEIRDPAGSPVIRVARLAGDTPLSSLALHSSSSLGRFTIDNPEVNVVLRDGGSNIEDTFARLLAGNEKQPPSNGPGPNLAIDVRGGMVSLKDTTSNTECRMSELQASVTKDAVAKPPLQVQAACNLASNAIQQPGRLQITLLTPNTADAPAAPGAAATDASQLALQAESVPLAAFQALVRRVAPGANVSGVLSSNINGQWAGESFKVNGQVDVSRLTQNVINAGQGGAQFAGGRITMNLESRPEATGRVWQGEFASDHLVAANAGRENNFDQAVKVSLLAHETATGPIVDHLQCDSSFLQLTASGTAEEFRATATCDLNAFATELSQFVDLGPSRPTGQGRIDLAGKRGADGGFAADGTADFRDLRVALAGLNIDEPTARLEVSGQWNPTTRKLQFSKTALAAQILSFSSDDLAITLPETGTPLVTGTLAYQGDIARLQRWLGDAKTPLQWQLAGQMSGQTMLTRDASGASAQSTTRFVNLAVYEAVAAAGRQPGTPVWSESQLDVTAKGRYENASDLLQLDTCEVSSDTLRVQGKGKIEKVSTQQALDLSGQAEYDWEKLTPLLWTYLGKDVHFTGHETRTFSVRGPLAPAAQGNQPAPSPLQTLTADAGIGWDTAEVYGLKVGKGELSAALRDGMLKISPIDWEVSEGRLTFAPTIRLAPGPAEMELAKGPVLTKVRLTPEMCHSAIKFVVPALADATKTDGSVSLEFSGGRVPLSDAAGADLAGTLTVHSVQVSPGPALQGIIPMLKELEAVIRKKTPTLGSTDADSTLLTVADQNVQFRMVDHRVYHRGLEMTVGRNIVIRTQGSVGVVDETLDMIVEIPIPDDWIGADPVAQGFKGQTVQIPIHGNLSNYKPDGSAIKAIAQQMLKNTARGLLQGELGNQLDKLFPPKR